MLDSTLALLVTLLACTLTFLVTLDLYKKRRILLFASQNKGYKFYPIIGNGHHFIGKDIFSSLKKLVDTHKLPCNLWAGQDYAYVTADPAELKLILNDESTVGRAYYYRIFTNVIGEDTLLTEPHEEWKKDRKLFSKSFAPRVLNNLVDLFYKNSCWLVEKFRESQAKLAINTLEVFTLKIITDSFTGKEGQLTIKECYDIADKLQIIEGVMGRRFLEDNYFPNILYAFTQESKTTKRYFTEMLEAFNKIIRKKRENLNNIEKSSVDELPLLDQLMRNEEKLSDEKISGNIILLVVASIHTTATSLLFTFILLGMHSEIQEKVYREVVDTVGLTNPITQTDLPNLKYTEMVIQESMRIFPTVHSVGRYVIHDLNLGTKTLPAGSNVILDMFHLHRDERFWKNPLKFDPNRFLPEEVANRHAYSYLPFSGGPKNCIGLKYAMMVLKTAVANVVRNHHFHSNHKSVKDIQLQGGVVLRTTANLDCTITPRKCI